jgi:hypothetical protein
MSEHPTKETMSIHICSNAEHIGSGRDRTGKMHYWEFHSYLGPTFTDAKGNVLKRQPMNANHKAWKPFEEWLAIKKLKKEIK